MKRRQQQTGLRVNDLEARLMPWKVESRDEHTTSLGRFYSTEPVKRMDWEPRKSKRLKMSVGFRLYMNPKRAILL